MLNGYEMQNENEVFFSVETELENGEIKKNYVDMTYGYDDGIIYVGLCDFFGVLKNGDMAMLFNELYGCFNYRETMKYFMLDNKLTEQEADDIIKASILVAKKKFDFNPFDIVSIEEGKELIEKYKLKKQIQELTIESLKEKSVDELEELKAKIDELLLKTE